VRIVALSGGVGGARFLRGLVRVADPADVTVIGNVGDDVEVLGMHVSPDLDSILYALAGVADDERGWGRADETWVAFEEASRLGGESWFQLGDGDLATHVERTRRLKAGETLSAVTDDFRRRLGIAARLLPMSDDPVRTRLRTDAGWLDFQDYFVRQRCEPAVREIAFVGAEDARPQPEFLAALRDASLRAIIVCPSNPLISIAPILAVSGVRAALRDCAAPVVAVSPIVAGRAIKGPTAKMMRELGLETTAAAVARHYGDLLDGYLVDRGDAGIAASCGGEVRSAATLMVTLTDREALAREVLAFADSLRSRAEAAGASA
jgi:LPPG:FO 2-phospho-L-lactate transferase